MRCLMRHWIGARMGYLKMQNDDSYLEVEVKRIQRRNRVISIPLLQKKLKMSYELAKTACEKWKKKGKSVKF